MTEIVDWAAIKTTIERETWAGRLFSTLKDTTDGWIESYKDDPKRIAGWFHNYNCEKCAARLSFNIESPKVHHCPTCGHENTGEKLDRAWNNMYRGRANATVHTAGVLFRLTNDTTYIEYIRKVLDFYSLHYDEFLPDPPAKAFEGKIMNQHLGDAVGMMSILLGMDAVREEFSEDELEKYYSRLFSREAELFDFFASRIYNIPVWIKCAQAMIGVFFGKHEQLDSGLYDTYGVVDQLSRGVTAEGLWYEGSMHYHFYTLQPICYLLYACRRHEMEIPKLAWIYETVERMFEYPAKMVFRDRSFPNPNDGHPNLTIDKYTVQYEYASVIFDNPLFTKICSTFYRDDGADNDDPDKPIKPGSVSRLLFNRQPRTDYDWDFGSINNPQSYTAILKSEDTELFIKYGQHTHLHVHPDVMNIEFAFDDDRVAYDLGTGGYASFLFAEWQRKTAAHNTVAIDGSNHFRLTDGIVESYDKKQPSIDVKAKGVYQAANFRRRVTLGKRSISDIFEVDARGEYTIDWFFYCKGEIECDYALEPVESIGDSEGYEHLFDIRRFITDDEWVVRFVLPDKIISVEMKGAPETQVHLVNSYTDSTKHTRYGLVVRRCGEQTMFSTEFSCKPV